MILITVRVAANQLGVSTKRVSYLCSQGKIKAQRLGARLYVIDPHSLEEYQRSETRKIYRPATDSPGRPPGKKKKARKIKG